MGIAVEKFSRSMRSRLRLARSGSSELAGTVASLLRSADTGKLASLRARVAAAYRKNPISAAKYADPKSWLLFNAVRVADLGLHRTKGLRVLDIGCGPGFFVALARALGHDAHGVDAPASYMTKVEQDVYSSLTDAFHCGGVVSPLLIERYKSLPFREEPFDLITAFWICFNRHRQADEWGVAEWRFFVEDALQCLRPGGRMVLGLNENAERYGANRFYDDATRDYFLSVGTVNGGVVMISRPASDAAAQ